MTKRLTREEFISRSSCIHSDKYDYSLVEYRNNATKVSIICKEHGEFAQSPSKHLSGQGCPKCADFMRNKNRIPTSTEFAEKANRVHSFRYDYSKSHYVNAIKKVTIICRDHGEFSQCPNSHLAGCGCPTCKKETLRNLKAESLEQVVERFKNKHGGKYIYDCVEYVNAQVKVKIICPDHGEFLQEPLNHVRGVGCPSCATYGFNMSETGYVYVLKGVKFNLMKIGVTNNIESRVSQLRKSTHFGFDLLSSRKFDVGSFAFKCEKELHTMFNRAGLSGFDGATEWFKYDESVVEKLKHWNS